MKDNMQKVKGAIYGLLLLWGAGLLSGPLWYGMTPVWAFFPLAATCLLMAGFSFYIIFEPWGI